MSENEYKKAIQNIESLNYYARKFQRLRVDRAHGVAPHKPILLLAVIEQFSRKNIIKNEIYLSSELIQIFLKYWSYLGSFHHKPDISRPFFHMRSGKFWHLWANPGFERIVDSHIKLKTFAEVREAVKFAYLDEDLYEILQEQSFRDSLVNVLVSRWFPGKLDLVRAIAQTDKFCDPPAYLITLEQEYNKLNEFYE